MPFEYVKEWRTLYMEPHLHKKAAHEIMYEIMDA
jgi:hypothetical protein